MDRRLTVVFRADASFTMGTGHVMRCLTLACGLQARGAAVSFVCREHPGHLIDLVRKRGMNVFSLPAPHARSEVDSVPVHAAWLGCSWREDADQTAAAIRTLPAKVELLVVDHYALDLRWETALRPLTNCVMAIDDLADRPHDCDILLDQNLVAQMLMRYSGKVPAACRVLLGPEYALLQPPYSELHDGIQPRKGPIKRILIFFGGADRTDLTGRSLSAFLELDRQDIEVDVVVSPGSPQGTKIWQLAAGHPNINVHVGLPSLAPLMANADLALGASGSTSWERLCLGLPSFVITLAANQTPVAEELHRLHLVTWLGHQDQVSDADLRNILGEITSRDLDPAWSRRCKDAVDGRGTERTLQAMLQQFGT